MGTPLAPGGLVQAVADDAFRCERLRCTLSRGVCVRRWQVAQLGNPCHLCAVGRAHAELAAATRPDPGTELQRQRAEVVLELLARLRCATPGQILHLTEGKLGLTRSALICKSLVFLMEGRRVEQVRAGVYRVAGAKASRPRPEPTSRGLTVHLARRRELLTWLSTIPHRAVSTAEAAAHLQAVGAPCADHPSPRLEEARVSLRVLRNQGHLVQVGRSLWRLVEQGGGQ